MKEKEECLQGIKCDRANVVFKWSPANKILRVADAADTLAFILSFEGTDKGFRLVKGKAESEAAVMKICVRTVWKGFEVPADGFKMTEQELKQDWECLENFDIEPGRVIVVETRAGFILMMKIGVINSSAFGDKEDSINFVYQIYKDRVE